MDLICKNVEFFKNPKKLPLNELSLERKTLKRVKKVPKDVSVDKISGDLPKYFDVRVEKIPALDASWIQEKHSYHNFQPYYLEVSPEENSLFLTQNKLFLESLKYILGRSFHQFWCLIVFEPKVRTVLNSFIENPMPWFEAQKLDPNYLEIYNECCDYYANIYLRMLRFHDSDFEFISEKTAIKNILETQLITYPKIVHFCVLYSDTNRKLIDRIMQLFFHDNRKQLYGKELMKIFNHALLVFETIGGQVCGFENTMEAVPNYLRKKPTSFDPYWYEEVASYLADTSSNLNAFLAVCKPAVYAAFKLGIPFRMTYFYNRVYHELYSIMKMDYHVPYEWQSVKERIYELLSISRSEFVGAYHVFVTGCIDQVVQLIGDNKKQEEYIERYLKLLTSTLEDEYFIFDYHNTNEIDVQIQMLSEFFPDLDHTRTNYILECLATLPNLQDLLKVKKEPQSSLNFSAGPSKVNLPNNTANIDGNSSKKLTERDLQDKIQSVLETLPHLGDGFILKCLENYNYDVTEVISAILDENLPPHLLEIPPDMIRIPDEPTPEQPILAYRGKKPGYSDAIDLLNDKSDLAITKEFILKKSEVTFDMYDDEYDDRDDAEPEIHFYDRNAEPDIYKYMENRFDGYDLVSDPSESSSDDEAPLPKKDAANSRNPKVGKSFRNNDKKREFLPFCEDPALVRERREASRRQFHGNGSRSDVVGKPKGQGQEANVQHNRDKKNVHKSSRANHNRKGGAQFKRNKGMLPS